MRMRPYWAGAEGLVGSGIDGAVDEGADGAGLVAEAGELGGVVGGRPLGDIGRLSGTVNGTCSMTERPLCVDSTARVKQVTMNRPAPIAVIFDITRLAPPPNNDCAADPPSVSAIPPRPPCTKIIPMSRRETTT